MFSSSASAPACSIMLRVLDPAAGRDAVQAADDRDIDRLLDALQVLQVGSGPRL